VVFEKFRIALKDFALLGVLDMIFKSDQAVAPGDVEDLEHHDEHIQVVFLGHAASHHALDLADYGLHDRQWS